MVKRNEELDAVFGSLSDPTRRDILRRLMARELSVSDIAESYEKQMSLAAVSKHLRVLEKARLVRKKRFGRELLVALSPPALKDAALYLERYRAMWEEKFDRLEVYLKSSP